MPFLPVTHASISLPLPIAPPRTFAAPRALECPRELRLARLGDPEPSGPLKLAFVSLSESGEGASRRLPLLSLREVSRLGWGREASSWVVGVGKGGTGTRSEREGAEETARDRERHGERDSDKRRAGCLLLCFFSFSLPHPPSLSLLSPFSAKLEPPRAPPARAAAPDVNLVPVGRTRAPRGLGTFPHSEVIPWVVRGESAPEPSCLHWGGRGARREGGAASTPPSGTEQ